MGATLLLHALLGASGASRLSQSRITSYFQPFEQGPLSADALQRARALRGDSWHCWLPPSDLHAVVHAPLREN